MKKICKDCGREFEPFTPHQVHGWRERCDRCTDERRKRLKRERYWAKKAQEARP